MHCYFGHKKMPILNAEMVKYVGWKFKLCCCDVD